MRKMGEMKDERKAGANRERDTERWRGGVLERIKRE